MNEIIIEISKPEISIQIEKPDIVIDMPGSQGMQGIAGKSAYELAVENGFTGTLQDWLNSVQGDLSHEHPFTFSDTETVTHNLGKYPIVILKDST